MPFRIASRSQLLVVCFYVLLPIIGDWGELAVVLQLVLELGKLGYNPFSLVLSLLILGTVCRAMYVIDTLGDDDGPSFTCGCVGERCWVAGAVLRYPR